MTMYDAVFMGITSIGRDESMYSFLLRVLFRLIINMTFSVVMVVIKVSASVVLMCAQRHRHRN